MSRYLDAIQKKKISDINDPGKDINPSDTTLWVKVLAKARETDNELYAKLLYIRGTGARLAVGVRTGYKIVPVIDPDGKRGWSSIKEYAGEKWCLEPHIQQLAKILQEVR